jgi:hypothetical protein
MRERRSLALGMIVLAVVAAACSSSTTSSTTTSPSPPSSSPSAEALCAQEGAVKASFGALVHTDVVAEGTNTLMRPFDAFVRDLASLRSAAGDRFSSQLDAVGSSVQQMKQVVDKADTADVATTAGQFVAALGNLKRSVESLFAAIDQACKS